MVPNPLKSSNLDQLALKGSAILSNTHTVYVHFSKFEIINYKFNCETAVA